MTYGYSHFIHFKTAATEVDIQFLSTWIMFSSLLPQFGSAFFSSKEGTFVHTMNVQVISVMNLVATHYICHTQILMDCISHHSMHSHIPIHHYTNHTAVSNHSLALIVSPHLHLIHTHTFKQHSYMHSLRSLVLAPADISERYSSCCLLSLCLTPDCPTLELWTCACDPDFCLVLFTSLPCLWYSCFCPLTFACLILPIKYLTALGSTRLWPVITISVWWWVFGSQSSFKVTPEVFSWD